MGQIRSPKQRALSVSCRICPILNRVKELDIPTTSALPKDHAIPSTSTAYDITSNVIPISITPEKTVSGSDKKCGEFIPTPDLVRLFPRSCIEKKKNGENLKRKSRIHTDTPEKNRLEQLKYERGLRKKNKEEKKIQKVVKKVFPEHT
ncbi:hypothetical protein JTB14_036319 [Gonioctena quinquepunctata]|nr:hypothetical protein JTB14_036319 [Gonioctena quinquepunctata]